MFISSKTFYHVVDVYVHHKRYVRHASYYLHQMGPNISFQILSALLTVTSVWHMLNTCVE
jgi:hypothetical protein